MILLSLKHFENQNFLSMNCKYLWMCDCGEPIAPAPATLKCVYANGYHEHIFQTQEEVGSVGRESQAQRRLKFSA